jgi:hypothetical protein
LTRCCRCMCLPQMLSKEGVEWVQTGMLADWEALAPEHSVNPAFISSAMYLHDTYDAPMAMEVSGALHAAAPHVHRTCTALASHPNPNRTCSAWNRTEPHLNRTRTAPAPYPYCTCTAPATAPHLHLHCTCTALAPHRVMIVIPLNASPPYGRIVRWDSWGGCRVRLAACNQPNMLQFLTSSDCMAK